MLQAPLTFSLAVDYSELSTYDLLHLAVRGMAYWRSFKLTRTLSDSTSGRNVSPPSHHMRPMFQSDYF
jgi:hypothetical protein